MKIEIYKISSEFDGERCYVHARGVLLPSGFGLITTQKLELSGCDAFYGIEMMKSDDGGKSFSSPEKSLGLSRRTRPDGLDEVMCDATPFYHEKTGKIILVGHLAIYEKDNVQTKTPIRKSTAYAVYDEEKGDFSPFKMIEMPIVNGDIYFSSGSGCSQIYECESGEILIPFYFRSYENTCTNIFHVSSSVMRCSFDGEEMKIIEIGNELSTTVPRGICEPSITKFGGEYFLALRNDVSGYVTKGIDGIHFNEPTPLCFDDGEPLGNYNTQQHWLVGGGKLWLVYTRRAGNNDHVFRHRAPLFIAELDRETLRVIRETETIAVPERGARLGNFGCQSYSDGFGYVFASEWMQGDYGLEGCTRYGSDNSIFVSKIIY
jgi:hypothetical protein